MRKYSPNIEYVAGIDEVGRGPVAGPVTVGVAVASREFLEAEFKRIFKNIKDHKKLTIKQRDIWHQEVSQCEKDEFLQISLSSVDSQTIDKIGIVKSIKQAINQSLNKLHLPPHKTLLLLDGGLKASSNYSHQETIIKGDEKEPIIAIAALMAKVFRDREMIQLAKKFPEYGFENHKGYGTKAHFEAIRKNGLSPIHRRCFLSKIKRL